jgi:L-serine dehydratase
MERDRYPDLFNYVFGPVMQPGSSSHTAGPCRLGLLAAGLLGEPVRDVRVTLDPGGSFAGAFGIMAEDSAMIAGALGLLPDDEKRKSLATKLHERARKFSFISRPSRLRAFA